jgi:hypothetical protein
MADLFSKQQQASGPVECLGKTFPSDRARREYFLKLLAEKLKDPAFRKIEGFPSGSDADILALSDPPYYTACPNPFVEEFLQHYGKADDRSGHYSREPFAVDVSEGKSDPIYNAHSYHTKVPHKAIMRYILHYTQPGDIVFDGFCGTGMTGVAAQLCADKDVVTSLGYRVGRDGEILQPEDEDGRQVWKSISKIGARFAVMGDLSPAATYIAHNYNSPLDGDTFDQNYKVILKDVEHECGWMYETSHIDGRSKGRINYTIWSDVFSCSHCAGEIIFWNAAVDKDAGKVRDEFKCPHCAVELTKRNIDHAQTTKLDGSLGRAITQARKVPVLINYSVSNKRHEKVPDAADMALIEKIESLDAPYWFPSDRLIEGGETRRNDPVGITHVHHFYTRRNLLALAAYRSRGVDSWAPFNALTPRATKMHRIAASRLGGEKKGVGGATVGVINGTLYVPSISVEMNVLDQAVERVKVFSKALFKSRPTITTTQSTTDFRTIQSNSIDYVFIDPPFGSNINYSELSFLWESWIKVFTNNEMEAIENRTQAKTLSSYRRLMTSCFGEAFRILKPDRWITIEFSNTQASVWNSIQTALQEAGFVVANVSSLDKQQGSFKAVTTTTAVKQDLVISAYKPSQDMVEGIARGGANAESVWAFTRSHLKHLPTTRTNQNGLEFIAERDPRILFDRMVSWFIRNNLPVPLSSQEFQAGLAQKFIVRDGMIFLPDQVSAYDKRRSQISIAPQMELFVSDERSAIDWITDYLKSRPSTYQEIHPEFISQLGAGWKKHEERPELSDLLEGNFIKYEGSGDVPSQIHSYLSSNHKELRSLEKSNPLLMAKAKDRWYVPDPNKAQDLEKKREKALLKEFDGYQAATGRKLKEFRLEVLRAGFKAAWAAKNYKAIIAIAQKIPEEALQEDEKLLLWYDQALTRTEAGA